MKRTPMWVMAAGLILCMTHAHTAHASGYGTVCGDENFSPPPTFDTYTELPELVGKIFAVRAIVEASAENPAIPNPLFGPGDPWTSWYRQDNIHDALARLAVMRGILDAFNLWDLYIGWFPPAAAPCPDNAGTVRQIDGTCNDPNRPMMGAANIRFGRNVQLFESNPATGESGLNPAAYPGPGAGAYLTCQMGSVDPTSTAALGCLDIMEPNPREVSRKLFTRGDDFKPVPFLNMLAAAWVQFQVHDWFDHGNNDLSRMHSIPLAADDPLRDAHDIDELLVPATAEDPMRQPGEAFLPPTPTNKVTHWWDGSQIYGSDLETANRLRSFEGGKMKVDGRGLLPVGDDGFEDTGMRRNWWIGLALMHTLFVHEHNAIADMLAANYPDWDDQKLYDTARMINAALIAKIHTLEWTPAILPNPTLEVAMNANWYGLNRYLSPQLEPESPLLTALVGGGIDFVLLHVFGVTDDDERAALVAHWTPIMIAQLSPVLFGVAGGTRDLKSNPVQPEVPFSMTQEFVSVYRMHTLLPDAMDVIDLDSGQKSGVIQTKNTRNQHGRRILEDHGMRDMLYSFGITNPGALVLKNYPEFLQELRTFTGPPIPGVPRVMDMGAIDVLRDRERGVPRYNEFRRQLRLPPVPSIDALTDDPELRAALKDVYGHDPLAIWRVDLLVGTLAESHRPDCYGFGETLFQVFTAIATRRLQGDRFYTDDYRPEVYTQEGLDWVENGSMKSVLLRHYPQLAETGLADIANAFYPWE